MHEWENLPIEQYLSRDRETMAPVSFPIFERERVTDLDGLGERLP